MRDASNEFSRKYLSSPGVVERTVGVVANSFVRAQESRHEADYDLHPLFRMWTPPPRSIQSSFLFSIGRRSGARHWRKTTCTHFSSKTDHEMRPKPDLAKAIETTPDALVLILEGKSVSIPWEDCSGRLSHASPAERNRAVLSPSGYGIHWPLIDEDLAAGPLLRASKV